MGINLLEEKLILHNENMNISKDAWIYEFLKEKLGHMIKTNYITPF